MPKTTIKALAACLLVTACAVTPTWPPLDAQRQAVEATERAFAQTMADRNFPAFSAYIADDAVFFGQQQVLRGRDAVLARWRPLFDGAAPFSWAPARVEVLGTGGLALSTGPVRDPAGVCIGSFTSIWRLEPQGHWRIVFDKGSSDCN